VDFVETEETVLLRDAVGGVARRYGHSYLVEAARHGRKTDELWDELAALGFLGVNLPTDYGGGGMGLSELAVVTEELAAAGCPMLLLLVSPAICGTLIAGFGTAEQKDRWLRPIAEGRARMAFALTEPDAGSNSHRLATVAAPRPDGSYVLRGTKHYISGVDEADAMLVVTRSSVDERTGRAQLSLFIVDTDAPGLERQPMQVEVVIPEKQFVLFFDDVEVSADRLVGAPGEGLRILFQGLNPERILGAALLNGIGRYALERAASYANDRAVWGVPIGAHQGLAHPLAEAKIAVELARLMTSKAAWLFDAGDDAGEASNMAKYAAAEAALAALDRAIQTHGGNGMATEFGLATMWGLARLLRIAPVSREMILNFVSQHSLGLPRSY
jgi:alkylation response protein AidB-like acyl-CoA dehydrogenase